MMSKPGLEKSSVLPVLDRFLKLKTDLFLDKKLKNRSIKLCISQDFAVHRLTLSPVRIVHTRAREIVGFAGSGPIF